MPTWFCGNIEKYPHRDDNIDPCADAEIDCYIRDPHESLNTCPHYGFDIVEYGSWKVLVYTDCSLW